MSAREYLQIVESRRDGGQVRQRVIATLGRRDQLVADGTLDQLLQSLARFSERLRVVERVRAAGLQAVASRAWGPALAFGRPWETQGLPELLRARGGSPLHVRRRAGGVRPGLAAALRSGQ